MSKTAGYIIILNEVRAISFHERSRGEFSEPVVEFSHSRNVPLICFIMTEEGGITHIGLGKRGATAGTGLRKLNIQEIFGLKKPISAIEIVQKTPPTIKHHLIKKIESGGLITPRSFEEFLSVFLEKAKEAAPILNRYSKERRIRIEQLSNLAKKSLAEQKEAVLTALNIADINRDKVRGWDYSEDKKNLSFLDGLENVRLREDSMIFNDLGNIPGFELIKSTKFSSSVFENDRTRLTVLLANRLPLEELLGTDLIYYNEDFKCFTMVQYKVMEQENDKFVFRLPNMQFSEEISRMDSINNSLQKKQVSKNVKDYRINNNPFFIKLCPRIEFNPDNIGLSSGMYVPLEYLKMLQKDKSIEGIRGGRAISFNNVGRYFDNTAFKTVVSGGWVGTHQNQSREIELMIGDILKNGRTAVLAIKKKINGGESTGESIVDLLLN